MVLTIMCTIQLSVLKKSFFVLMRQRACYYLKLCGCPSKPNNSESSHKVYKNNEYILCVCDVHIHKRKQYWEKEKNIEILLLDDFFSKYMTNNVFKIWPITYLVMSAGFELRSSYSMYYAMNKYIIGRWVHMLFVYLLLTFMS